MVAAASAFLAVESSGPARSTASAWMAVIAYPCWIATQVCLDYTSGSRLRPGAARYPQSGAGLSRSRQPMGDRKEHVLPRSRHVLEPVRLAHELDQRHDVGRRRRVVDIRIGDHLDDIARRASPVSRQVEIDLCRVGRIFLDEGVRLLMSREDGFADSRVVLVERLRRDLDNTAICEAVFAAHQE